MKNRGAEVYTLVTNLSKIMRYSMNTDEDKVTLKREAANAEAFLLLHKERYCDEFEYAIDFEQEALRALLPKMLLQPVIENYFKHGIGTETGKKGRLRVEGRKEGDSLVIRIADNGPGIDPGRMQELDRRLREEKRSEPGEEANIGLRSVYLRLKLYYGARGSLQLENRREGGLLVTIRLPIEFEGGDGAE